MNARPSIIERAFQLANSGRCADIKDIRAQLTCEDYQNVEGVIRGTSLLVQLRLQIATALKEHAAAQII